MEDLPDLPFERILSHLELKDLLKLRAVSRGWFHMFDNLRVKSLCFSMHPSGFIFEESRWVSDAFARNFINSARFAQFFNAFHKTILSNLKHLRLCDLRLSKEDKAPAFAQILHLFGQLEKLDIIGFRVQWVSGTHLKLNLPMLQSFQLMEVLGSWKLTLNSPNLKEVKISYLNSNTIRVHLVPGDSVERLNADQLEHVPMENLKSLRYLCTKGWRSIDPTLLFSLEQLKEIHLNDRHSSQRIERLFRHKQLHGRAELKIYLHGVLLSGPDDPAIRPLLNFTMDYLNCLAENHSKLADEIPFRPCIRYREIERFVSGYEINILKRFTDLCRVSVCRPVQDVEHFLLLLKNVQRIVELRFDGNQPQDLYDRLPERSAIKRLMIFSRVAPSDFRFLLRMKSLIFLKLESCLIDTEILLELLEKIQFISRIEFRYNNNTKSARIEIDRNKSNPFKVVISGRFIMHVATPTATVQLIK